MEIVLGVVIGALFLALLVFAARYNWLSDPSDDDEQFPPTAALPRLDKPRPVAGWEWSGLRAHDAQSLIPPDAYSSYVVRINDDGSFSVKSVPIPAPLEHAEVAMTESPD